MSTSYDTPRTIDSRDDASLLAASVSGDEHAFRALFDRHVDAITGYLAARVGPDASDDLVIETFATAWKAAGRFDTAADSARPWLFGIATNHVHRHRKRERRWQESLIREASSIGAAADNDPAELHVDATLARAALARLSPAEREVLLLVSVGELRLTEAAHAAGIRESAARMRLMRARRELSDFLADHAAGGSHD